jgi:hypothetical protein
MYVIILVWWCVVWRKGGRPGPIWNGNNLGTRYRAKQTLGMKNRFKINGIKKTLKLSRDMERCGLFWSLEWRASWERDRSVNGLEHSCMIDCSISHIQIDSLHRVDP